MIAIIDYGVGNLFSLTASLKKLGIESKITNDKDEIINADKIILPGVGAFEDAIGKLNGTGLVNTILDEVKKGKPLLGICLGMQLLFEESNEYGNHKGLGLIKGEIASIKDENPKDEKGESLKVPHMGWNSLNFDPECPIFKYIKQGDRVYYVHSFYGKNCEEATVGWSEYGIKITGAVRNGNVYGTQFHPEKSGSVGLNILKAFNEL